MKNTIFSACCAILLMGCANQLYPSFDQYFDAKRLPPVTQDDFPHCQDYGCRTYKNVILNSHDWKRIEKAFGGKAKNAKEEREKTALTVGTFERIVGPMTKTDGDIAGTFGKTGHGQLDCVDESTNTTIYLMLLKQRGLLRFHEIEQPQVRYPIISGRGWMHQTAVLAEKETGTQYAVDSWFEDGGYPAYVVPLEAWRNGWHPGVTGQEWPAESPMAKGRKSP